MKKNVTAITRELARNAADPSKKKTPRAAQHKPRNTYLELLLPELQAQDRIREESLLWAELPSSSLRYRLVRALGFEDDEEEYS